MTIDERVRALGLVLPAEFRRPTGAAYPFAWVRVRGNRAYVSGHLPPQADGTLFEPRGRAGEALSAPSTTQLAGVVNGFSDLIIEVFGRAHT